ncbi:MAG: hypothetical protein VX768_12115 [Planctomycetota bacterium]|nr:hypothetical protein [Planctomycetota bacterium]
MKNLKKTKQNCLVWIFLLVLPHAVVCPQASFSRVETLAGNGKPGPPTAGHPLEVPVSNPFGIHPTPDGGLVIVSFDQHVILKINSGGTLLKVIGGTGTRGNSGKEKSLATRVQENSPHEVQVDSEGNVLVADTFNHRVGIIRQSSGTWETLAGTGQAGFSGDEGPARQASFHQAYSIALSGDQLFVADLKNHRIRQIHMKKGTIHTVCGTGKRKMPRDGELAKTQPLSGPRSLAVDKKNLWIVLREGNSVWRMDRKSKRLYHVAGTGKKGFSGDGGDARKAALSGPKGIAVDPGKAIYIADTENHAIRRVDLVTRQISTVMGGTGKKGFDGDGLNVQMRMLARPHGVFLMANGDLLVGDSENHRVRRLIKDD